MEGWIKIHRKILSHWIWADEKYFRWWMTILLMVNHKASKFPVSSKLYECLPGQSFRKIESWAQLFGCSKKTVVKFFDMLKKDGMISIEIIGKGNRRKHLLSVENWANYQQSETEHVPELKPKTTPKGNRTGNPNIPSNKNDKEGNKNEKNISLYRKKYFSILEIFYFRNFNRPINVTNHFYRHYEATNWKNGNDVTIESIESVAGNWDNKLTEGVNCPQNLLLSWENIYNYFKTQKLTVGETEIHKLLLAVRPAKLENEKLRLRGKKAVLNMIGENESLQKMLLQQFKTHYEVREFEIEPDKTEEEPTIIIKDQLSD